MPDDTNAQKIQAFNQTRTAAGAQLPPGQQPAVVNPSAHMSVADIQLLLQDPATLTPEEALRRQALATKENLRIAEEERRKQEEAILAQARKEANVGDVVKTEVTRGLRSANQRTQPAQRWAASRPTPGGIATLLILIGVFLMAIVPVDNQGNTRLKLLWLTITGKTHLSYAGQSASTTSPSVLPLGNTPSPLPTPSPFPFPSPSPIPKPSVGAVTSGGATTGGGADFGNQNLQGGGANFGATLPAGVNLFGLLGL